MQCQKSLMLRWHSPMSSPQKHTYSHWVLNNCAYNPYSLFWQSVYRIYVLSCDSKIFETSQFLSHHHTPNLHHEWYKSIAIQRFWPAIYRIKIHQLISNINSATSSPFLIQLILLDFHHVPEAIFDFLTISRRSERRVMLLAACITADWQLSFFWDSDVLWPLILWVVWHHWLTLC